MSNRTAEDFALETSPFRRFVRGMNRRYEVLRTTEVKWQVRGQKGGSGGDEVVDIEPFTGIGFFSRPPNSGKPEVVAACIGGPKHQVIVATRDEATRKKIDSQVADGGVCVYNDQAMILVTPDGHVEIRLIGGVAIKLPTLADVDALRTAFNAHTHLVSTTGTAAAQTGTAAAIIPAQQAPALVGTTVLKAQ